MGTLINEDDWIGFGEAVPITEKRFGCDEEEARCRLREACAEGSIYSAKAPYEEEGTEIFFAPFDEWTEIPSGEWRKRKVDHDGPDGLGREALIMLSQIHFNDWLKPKSLTLVRKLPKRSSAEDAIKHIWPDGIPDGIVNGDIEKKVGAWLKERGLSDVSRDTILRAAGRKA